MAKSYTVRGVESRKYILELRNFGASPDTDFSLTTYIPVSYPHKPCNEFIPPKFLNSKRTLRDSTPRIV